MALSEVLAAFFVDEDARLGFAAIFSVFAFSINMAGMEINFARRFMYDIVGLAVAQLLCRGQAIVIIVRLIVSILVLFHGVSIGD